MKGAIKELSEIIATVTRLIGYVLLVLRACDVVDWPWYMVLLPLRKRDMAESNAVYLRKRNMEESDMSELQKELEAVWKLLAAIPVQGDAVDVLAAARGGLRRAFKLAEGDDTNGG